MRASIWNAVRCSTRLAGLVLAAALLLAPDTAEAKPVLKGTASVLDAGTLRLKGHTIRLSGLYAPDRRKLCLRLWPAAGAPGAWDCGEQAAKALERKVAGAGVRCTDLKRSRGRLIGRCHTADGTELNAWMVRQGWANVLPAYKRVYGKAEAAAKARQAGMWNGQFIQTSALTKVRFNHRSSRGNRGLTIVLAALPQTIRRVG